MKNITQTPMSRARLESLSTGELIKLSEGLGIDIPRGLERIFIIEELLECSGVNAQEKKDDMENDPSCSETAVLPKKYNISYVEVLTRDPLWVFVYWEIKSHDRELYENANDFKGYCLRLVSLNGDETDSFAGDNSFIVPVDAEDCARYIGLTDHSLRSGERHLIKLGVTHGDLETQIAVSQPFYMPALIENEDIISVKENPLSRLSAAADLLIIRNIDRQSRIKRQ